LPLDFHTIAIVAGAAAIVYLAWEVGRIWDEVLRQLEQHQDDTWRLDARCDDLASRNDNLHPLVIDSRRVLYPWGEGGDSHECN
jgi:hypothetical protein